jgi:hypothetical protein
MRKLVYSLVAVLCFYASSNCYAQTDKEIATAKKQHTTFKGYYKTLKTNLDASLKEAKASQKNGSSFDNTRYKTYKGTLEEEYNDYGIPVIKLQRKYPVVRNIGNKELEDWKDDIESKYAELSRVVASIDDIVKRLKPSQLTFNRESGNMLIAALRLKGCPVWQPSVCDYYV